MAVLLAFATHSLPTQAQELAPDLSGGPSHASSEEPLAPQPLVSGADPAAASSLSSSSNLPDAPDFAFMAAPNPALGAANPQREGVPWAAVWHQQIFSRIGIGADVSLLGIGIKATTPLDDYFDLRGMFNFLGYTSGRFEVDGFNINANIHMASIGAAADFYPKNSMVRLSGGAYLYNGNKLSAATKIAGGTSFTLDGQNYYSSTATPLTGEAVLGLNTAKVAPMFSFGFGRFVPHSNRHWSFPSEIGAFYMGAPTITVSTAGEVCTDKAQTKCTDVGDQSNPIGIEFNNSLNGQLARWRTDLDKVKFYPIFAFSVVYSFNIR
jgi:hypothetical protein